MPLDALCLSGLVRELDGIVTGGKLDKIYQPGRDEVLLGRAHPELTGTCGCCCPPTPTTPGPS